jgi:hypothetical protein
MAPVFFDKQLLRTHVAQELLERFGSTCQDKDYNYCPSESTPKQAEFLALTCTEALFGGAAGGGKSECLLMNALEHVRDPNYAGLILRRTYADLALPGAIMDRATSWLLGSPAKWHGTDKKWTFPSGAVLQFGYLDREADKYRYQSAEFQYIAFDELTQFTESQYLYLKSRLRRKAGSKIPLKIRTASNPGGIGHDWVKARFVDGGEHAFIPSLLSDNPHIDQASYRKELEGLDSVTRAQLLEGRWIRDDGGVVYSYRDGRNGIEVTDLPDVSRETRYVLGIDLGATAKEATTAFVIIRYDHDNPDTVTIIDSFAVAGATPSSIAQEITRLDKEYGGFTRIVCDAGALGKGYVEEFRQRWCLAVEPARKQDKYAYIRIMNGDLENEKLKIIRSQNSELIEEMQSLQWDKNGQKPLDGSPNHLSDAALYAWREAKHWLAKIPAVIPKRGTRERLKWEEKEMLRQDENKNQDPWWQR